MWPGNSQFGGYDFLGHGSKVCPNRSMCLYQIMMMKLIIFMIVMMFMMMKMVSMKPNLQTNGLFANVYKMVSVKPNLQTICLFVNV